MLVEQAHDLISAHTTDDRTVFLYASNAFQRVLGISTEVKAIFFFYHVVGVCDEDFRGYLNRGNKVAIVGPHAFSFLALVREVGRVEGRLNRDIVFTAFC